MSKNAGIKRVIKEFQTLCRSVANNLTGVEELDNHMKGEIAIQATFSVDFVYSFQGIEITYEQARRILTKAGALERPLECHKSSIWLQLAKSDRAGLLSILDHSEGKGSVLD
jgi:hypothetical protein